MKNFSLTLRALLGTLFLVPVLATALTRPDGC